jgi:polyisoprenoid-binding protein YceI
MKKIVIALTLLLATGGINIMFAQKYKADLNETKLHWLGEKVTGEHDGSVNLKSGELMLSGDKISSGSFVIDMTSIVNEDMEDPGYKAKLEGHLKSDDFFGVEKYPTATLIITNSESFKNGSGKITGDLTIKGKTKAIEFNAAMQDVDNGKRFYANITVDRTDFDVKYGSGNFFDNLGDKTIYDEFKIKLNMLVTK